VERIGEVEALRISGPVELKLRYASTDLAERHPFDGGGSSGSMGLRCCSKVGTPWMSCALC